MDQFRILADLFRYPGPELAQNATEAGKMLEARYPQAFKHYAPFWEHATKRDLHTQEEYYIKTFDVQAVCYLDLGYVIFGEDYKRGEFLVKIQELQNLTGNNCGFELADHLPNVLTLLPKMKDPKEAEEIVVTVAMPALRAMIKKFKNRNAYKNLLGALLEVMVSSFPDSNFEPFEFEETRDSGFLSMYKNGIDRSLFERKPKN